MDLPVVLLAELRVHSGRWTPLDWLGIVSVSCLFSIVFVFPLISRVKSAIKDGVLETPSDQLGTYLAEPVEGF